MRISEIRHEVSEEESLRIAEVFTEVFGNPPSDSFRERLNEKRDLSVLLAHDEGARAIGFKIGYARFKGIFYSWLGGVTSEHRRGGFARALLHQQHELCLKRGYSEVQTETAGTNTGMLILNLSEGFEIYGTHLGHADALTVQMRKRFS